MAPPWSLRVQDEAPLAAIAQFSGEAWIVPEGGEAVHLKPGDVALRAGRTTT